MSTIFQCKMCGAALPVMEGSTICECEYCETIQTIPELGNEKKANLFNRANRFRFNNDFDAAAIIFENIIAEFPEEAEAYWGLCLCKYGIEYVDDSITAKKIPTCHRTRFVSIFDDYDYIQVCEYADAEAQRIYQNEAKSIDIIQQTALSIAANEPPYDIFICYKEDDDFGNRTKDSFIAQNIYDTLIENGYRVFFSRKTLENKSRDEYEPYVFSALNSVRIMLVVGTEINYFHDVWVKNEWRRFWMLSRNDNSKLLIPCFLELNPAAMPREFNGLQGVDIEKIGFLQDLLNVINTKLQSKNLMANSTIIVLLKSGNEALKNSKWKEAKKAFDEIIDINAAEVRAYLGLLLCDLRIKSLEKLRDYSEAFDSNYLYQRILRFGDTEISRQLSAINKSIVERINFSKFNGAYCEAKQTLERAISEDDFFAAANKFKEISSYKNSAAMVEVCEKRRLEFVYNSAVKLMNSAHSAKDFYIAYNIFDKIKTYKDSIQKQEYCRQNSFEVFYAEAKIFMNGGEYQSAAERFNIIQDYKDAKALGVQCIDIFNRKNNEAIYAKALSLENNKCLEDYEKAIELYFRLSGWADSKKHLNKCKINAVKLRIKNGIYRDEDKYEIKLLKRKKAMTVSAAVMSILMVAAIVFLWLTVISPFRISDGVLTKYMGFSKDITIPQSVTEIGAEAFKDKKDIINIVIPDNVAKIGWSAFENCNNLKNINIPNGIVSIESRTFKGCSSLTSCLLPNSVKTIGVKAFLGCYSLVNVSMPKGITTIEVGAFSECISLEVINIPDGVTSISDSLFSGCRSLETIVLPDNITSIGSNSFDGCTSLATINISNNVTSIGVRAFGDCTVLTTINIPTKITAIKSETFSGCFSLKNITIPNSVTSIDDGAFYICRKLTDVTIPNSIKQIGRNVFFQCYDINITYNGNTYDYDSEEQLRKAINNK